MKMGMMLGLAAVLAAAPGISDAHGGRTNSEGCHNERATGGYHCHGGTSAPRQTSASNSFAPASAARKSSGAFANCSAARTAGAAPVRRGQAGYGPHLDRDGDGVACE